jgi:hypothetical protein
VPASALSRRNLFTAGAGAAFAAVLADAAADPLFAGTRPDLPLANWAAVAGQSAGARAGRLAAVFPGFQAPAYLGIVQAAG